MHRAPPALFLCILLALPLFAGCLDDGREKATVQSVDWQVGDRWVYKRSSSNGAADTVYERQVNGLFDKAGHEVFELKEGIRGHPVQQYNLYTVDHLRFLGMDVREGGELLQRLDPASPLVFHYLFPLEPGKTVTMEGRIHQTAGGLQQDDTVTISATAGAPRDLRLGERVYEVWPYEIRITYTTTPFDEPAVIRGHWAPKVGQSVLTTIDEGGEQRTYELLSFDRAAPRSGAPAYDLIPGLESRPLDRGFTARLDDAGFARYLFHVDEPKAVEARFSFPLADAPGGTERLDFAAIRPLGYARAGITSEPSGIAADGVVMHLAAHEPGTEPFIFHSPDTAGLDSIALEPGHVYEVVLASNRGGLSVTVLHGNEIQALPPAERGAVDVIALDRSRVRETTAPGPQNVQHTVTAFVSLPERTRIEGLVYARNLGGAEDAIGEVNPVRRVTLQVDGSPFEADDALYGYYLHYSRREPFRIDTTFSYTADVAVQGVVDYEVGALLLRLAPWAG